MKRMTGKLYVCEALHRSRLTALQTHQIGTKYFMKALFDKRLTIY